MKMADAGSDRDRFSVVWAPGETPAFQAGDRVRVSDRVPVGHYRVPHYLRGKTGTVELVIEPMSMDNEEEGYGRFQKIINTEEKRRGVEALGTDLVGALSYYERWIAAFANILFQKGILKPSELAEKMREVEAQ